MAQKMESRTLDSSAILLKERRYTSDVADDVVEDDYMDVEERQPMPRTRPKPHQTQAQADIRRATADYTMQKSRVPERNTASRPGGQNTTPSTRRPQPHQYYESRTEKLPRQSLLTRISVARVTISLGVGLLSILVSWIGVTNVEAWYANNQDMSYYSQLNNRDNIQVGNEHVYAIIAGNQVDMVIIENGNVHKSLIIAGPKLKGDTNKVSLEIENDYDAVVTIHARSERVAGLTLSAHQDDIPWSVDLSKPENGGAK